VYSERKFSQRRKWDKTRERSGAENGLLDFCNCIEENRKGKREEIFNFQKFLRRRNGRRFTNRNGRKHLSFSGRKIGEAPSIRLGGNQFVGHRREGGDLPQVERKMRGGGKTGKIGLGVIEGPERRRKPIPPKGRGPQKLSNKYPEKPGEKRARVVVNLP